MALQSESAGISDIVCGQCGVKILLLTASFPPPATGGSVEYVYNIFSHLPPRCATIHTGNTDLSISEKFDRGFPQQVIRNRFILQVIGGYKATKWRRLCEYVLWPCVALALIVRERPDVIHLGEVNIAGLSAWLARKFLGIPYVTYTYAEEITSLSTRWIHKRILSMILLGSDAVVSVSDYTLRLVKDLGVQADKTVKIVPAVRQDKYAPVTQEELDAVRHKYHLDGWRVLLTVGRLVRRKGHSSVIEILPRISTVAHQVKYVIVGTGPEETALKRQVSEMNLEEQVIFTGKIDDHELACLYEICDVFVMPHRQLADTLDTEGCPTVFLEASAHGKPVIGGNAGGVTDAILNQRTGLIVDGTNSEALVGAIRELLENPRLAHEFGQAGREYASALTPESNAQAIWALSQRLVCNRRANV